MTKLKYCGKTRTLACRIYKPCPSQYCQFGFFEAKFVIFGLFLTPLAVFSFVKKGQIKYGFF